MRYEVMDGVETIEFLEMNPDEYNKIILKLETETNIKFKYYQKNYVIKRIKSRIKALCLPSDAAYYDYLKHHAEEIDLFLDNFTINYSYFFRNYGVLQSIVDIIDKASLNSQDKVKIWSCPCASGEEPYSLAILLEEKKSLKKGFPNYEIVGSDINPNAIGAARRGIYREHVLNETPKPLRRKYFTRISDTEPKYKLAKNIRNCVEFVNEDITFGHQKSQKYDIILCRNFIIYINRIYRKELLQQLKMSLKASGLLVIGKTEEIESKNEFKLIDPVNKFYKYTLKDETPYKSPLFIETEENGASERLAAKLEKKLSKTRKKTYKERAKKKDNTIKTKPKEKKRKKKRKLLSLH